eukprot:TRINITY_DN10648_c0_g2_i2.p1 TRINITY_DN10648_c0_g2~~TRINITY_DN10648_c0_g2_i2.p1  ORF type:complete len:307 (+),score=99.91 TRINITY_DN10648_c0_g2_i2:91-1011(+)
MQIHTLRRTFPLARCIVSRAKLKTLRDITGSPITACKTALDETNQDVQKAKELLETRGLAYPKPRGIARTKRLARRYKDGYVSLHDGEEGVRVVQLSCETDFVARTKEFTDSLKAFMNALAKCPNETIDNTEIEKFMEMKLVDEKEDRHNNKTIKEVLALLSSNTLENCDINNLLKRTVRPGLVIGSYLHGELEGRAGEPRIGTRAGVAVCESQSRNIAGVKKLANSIAMQVAAMKPMYIAKELMPENLLESKGKDKGFLEEMVLMEQQYVDTDEKKTVNEAIIQKQYELKAEIKFKEIFYYDCKQ